MCARYICMCNGGYLLDNMKTRTPRQIAIFNRYRMETPPECMTDIYESRD